MKLRENLQRIVEAPDQGVGMDVIIVSTTSKDQEDFWQERLTAGLGQIGKQDAVVVAVNEDWPGGAGNGLGTLYAVQKAAAKAKDLLGVDLLQTLNDGAAVGLYHTAGKGTRLAPLPGSESNNKPAVKLPGLIEINGEQVAMTILEGVIRQTAIYAASRRGRISVFWGDQIFIPSADACYDTTHHVDILARLAPMPDAETWATEGLHKYGLIAVGADGDASQVEKITHATAVQLIDDGVIQVAGGIGVSLGSFSISAAMTTALLEEFAPELQAKTEKFDTDPHFWMPMTLDEKTYVEIMGGKEVPVADAKAHYNRIQDFLARFRDANADARIFGCVDIGADSYWWDYGQLRYYMAENLKLTEAGEESDAMRRFFGIGDHRIHSKLGPGLDVDDDSILLNCNIREGTIRESVLIGVNAEGLNLNNSVLVNVAVPHVRGENVLLYNVGAVEPLAPGVGSVRADAFVPGDGQHAMSTTLERDGKEDWHEKLPGNPLSYDELHRANLQVRPSEATAMASETLRLINEKLNNNP